MDLNKMLEQIQKNNLVLQIRYDYPDFLIEVREHGGSHREIAVIDKEILDKALHPNEMIKEKILNAIERII
ncbi:hypothetical protein [Eubacterium ramulus]